MLCNLSMTCDSYCELFGSYRWLPIQLSSAITSCLKIFINLQRLRAWQKARNTFAFMLSNLNSCANQKHRKTPLAQSRTMALKLCQHTLPSLPSLPVSQSSPPNGQLKQWKLQHWRMGQQAVLTVESRCLGYRWLMRVLQNMSTVYIQK